MVLDNTGRGGAQSYAMNVLRNIDQERFNIDFVVNRNPKNGYGDEIIKLGSRIHYIPKFKVYNWSAYSKAWHTILRKYKYNIIHGHVSSTAGIYLKLAKKYGCTTIAHSHSAGYRGNWFEKKIKQIFTKSAKIYADYWFACSDIAAKRLFGENHKNNPNYYEIPNAIISSKYKFDEKIRNKLRTQLGINEETLLVGHVGSFSEPKNHAFLLEIFKNIKKRTACAKLLLVGEGPLKQDIDNNAHKLNIFDDIIFTGNVANVNEYMMAMDVMIFPSLFEGFPVTVIEAQASGLYTVLSNTITQQVYLTKHLVPMSLEDDPSVWAQVALDYKSDDRITANDIINASCFNMDNSIKNLEELYKKMHR